MLVLGHDHGKLNARGSFSFPQSKTSSATSTKKASSSGGANFQTRYYTVIALSDDHCRVTDAPDYLLVSHYLFSRSCPSLLSFTTYVRVLGYLMTVNSSQDDWSIPTPRRLFLVLLRVCRVSTTQQYIWLRL